MFGYHLEADLIRGIESLILSNEKRSYVIALGFGSIFFGFQTFYKVSD